MWQKVRAHTPDCHTTRTPIHVAESTRPHVELPHKHAAPTSAAQTTRQPPASILRYNFTVAQHVRRNEVASSAADAMDELEAAGYANAVQAMMDRLATETGLSSTAKDLGVVAANTAGALATGSEASGLPIATVAALLVSVFSGARADGQRRSVPLTPPEQPVWERVGASFRGADSEVSNRARSRIAFDLLVLDSIVGDTDMARELGVDRTRVSQRVSEKSLYAFDGPSGRCFPRWQIFKGKPIRELKALLTAFDPTLHPLTVDHWVKARNVELEVDGEAVTPIEWLSTGGNIDLITELAKQL